MSVKPGVRFLVLRLDRFTCQYCGKRAPEAQLEVDHVTPVSAGGADDLSNLVTACEECNIGKGAREVLSAFTERMQERAERIAAEVFTFPGGTRRKAPTPLNGGRKTIDFGELLEDLEGAVVGLRHRTLSECVRSYVRQGLERDGLLTAVERREVAAAT